MSIESVFSSPSALISKVKHKSEASRFIIAVITVLPLIALICFFIYATEGRALIIVAVYALLILFFLWLLSKLVQSTLLMNAVEVNDSNFTTLAKSIAEAKSLLKYEKEISAYVIPKSQTWINVLHILNRKVFVVESAFLQNTPPKEVINYAVMFHVARLKTRSEYISFLTGFISGIEKVWVLNMFLFPFERATVYTADRIATVYAGTPEISKLALAREMVGTELGKTMDTTAIMSQAERNRGFFAWLARSFSPFPGYSNRFEQIVAFGEANSTLMMERHQP